MLCSRSVVGTTVLLVPLLAMACSAEVAPATAPVSPAGEPPAQSVPAVQRETGYESPGRTPAPSAPPGEPIGLLSQEEAGMLMEELVRSDPTFMFDGIEETLKLTQVTAGDELDSWTFTFVFQSRHPGYGDRTGRVLAQVLTSHTAVIVFEQGEIQSAVIDGKWDMLEESEI